MEQTLPTSSLMKDKTLKTTSMFWRKFQLSFSTNAQCIRIAQRHSLFLACYFSWLALSRLQFTSTALSWLTGAIKSPSIRGALKIMGLTMVVNASTAPLCFSPSNIQLCPELQPKALPHLQLTEKLSNRALSQAQVQLWLPVVPGTWGQRVTAATRCHLCTEAAGSVAVHGHGQTRAAPPPLHFSQLRHKLREVFRTSFLQVTGFSLPEHLLSLRPSVAYFGHCSAGVAPIPLPRQGGADPSLGCSCSTHGSENGPCPAPRSAAGRGNKTLFFKAYFISTDLFLHRY